MMHWYRYYLQAALCKNTKFEERNGDKSAEVNRLKLIQLSDKDFDDVLELLLDDFIRNEPLSNALNLTRNEAHWLFKELTRSTVSSPVSYAFKTPEGKLAAMRLCNIIERPEHNDEKGFFSLVDSLSAEESAKLGSKAHEISRIVSELENKNSIQSDSVNVTNCLETFQTWELVGSEVNRLLNVVILCCHRNWTHRGLVSRLLECDMDKQKSMGIDGAISEATAYRSQNLYKKYGYKPIYEIKHAEWLDKNNQRIFKCNDGTNVAQLVFKKY
ncbi:unnamed protein product [Anisakis simplex]|uniref:N-acetyltransferase domain-containing protein n=1 Tax=Anisakis simplex TaxID=6269 RepID=A0A0M3K6H3_ANISI|nr:unnamed protein product [Anisakis simplex]